MRERLLRVLRDLGYRFHSRAKSDRNEFYRKGAHLVNLPRQDVLSLVYVQSTLHQVGATEEQVRFVTTEPAPDLHFLI